MSTEGIIQAVGSIVSAASAAHAASQQNQMASQAEKERAAQLKKYSDLTDNPDKLLANIMKLKRSMTKQEQDMITRAVTGRLIQSGQAGASGLIQEAVAEALAKADIDLFSEASKTYTSTLGLPATVLRNQPAAVPYGDTSKAMSGAMEGLAKLFAPKKPDTKTPDAPQAAPGTSDTTSYDLTSLGFNDQGV